MAKYFSNIHSLQTVGISAQPISIETDITETSGKNSFVIVGLPDKAVEEARDRIGAAIKNATFDPPQKGSGKTIISLAPADVKKEGPLFDLGMALGYLLADKQIAFNPAGKIFLGELSLDGALRPVKGMLVLAKRAAALGYTELFVPAENAREAALIDGICVYGAKSLQEVIEHLDIAPKRSGQGGSFDAQGTFNKKEARILLRPQPRTPIVQKSAATHIDFSDVRDQESAKRGLEIAAAGGHNVAMFGPPGTGKTMLARAFSGILPQLSYEEVLEVTGIHSVAGTLREQIHTAAPFRAPHHTSSYVSIVGGGTFPKPGEITLAHRGVLFMDEFPEFEKRVLESLRQPLEDRVINISRVKGSETFPANFILVAAMNPCPCGHFGSQQKSCTCTQSQLHSYQRKLSGPIMDRIDLWLEVGAVDYEKLASQQVARGESAEVKARVCAAREIQKERLRASRAATNGEMSARDIEEHAALLPEASQTLLQASRAMNLSPRSYHKIIKVARTIADLNHEASVSKKHILEALNYRPKEKL